jgi:HTH-type transcriptional regulator/antitoxin HigA
MQAAEIENAVHHYQEICHSIPLYPIRDEAEYDRAIQVLNELLDAGGADENHPLAMLVTLLGHFIGDYERIHYALDETTH